MVIKVNKSGDGGGNGDEIEEIEETRMNRAMEVEEEIQLIDADSNTLPNSVKPSDVNLNLSLNSMEVSTVDPDDYGHHNPNHLLKLHSMKQRLFKERKWYHGNRVTFAFHHHHHHPQSSQLYSNRVSSATPKMKLLQSTTATWPSPASSSSVHHLNNNNNQNSESNSQSSISGPLEMALRAI